MCKTFSVLRRRFDAIVGNKFSSLQLRYDAMFRGYLMVIMVYVRVCTYVKSRKCSRFLIAPPLRRTAIVVLGGI